MIYFIKINKQLMKIKILSAILFLTILYGVYGPTDDGREPLRSDISDPVELQSLGIDLGRLKNAQYIQNERQFDNAEDFAIDKEGNIYAGTVKGTLMKVTPQRKFERLGKVQGLILGVSLDQENDQLIFVSEDLGICSINLKTKTIETILSKEKYPQIVFINSITIDANGVLYFTKTGKHLRQLLRGYQDGSIFAYDRKNEKLQILIDHLNFPNGIVHNKENNPQTECIYVSEMGKYRVLRVYLRGQKRGKSEIIIDNIHGYPDNLKINDKGELWLGTPGLRDKMSTYIERSTTIRRILLNFRIPESVFLILANTSFSGGIKIDPKKKEIVEYMYGRPQKTDFITTIVEHDGKLYMSSLKNSCIMIIPYQ